MIRHIRLLAIVCLCASFAGGCGGEAPSPISAISVPEISGPETAAQPSARGFYPLEIGDWWRHHRRFEITIIPLNGPAGAPTAVFEGTVERRLIVTEEIFDRDYIVEETKLYVDGDADTVRGWRRYRQDHAGLYLADVSSREPPASASQTDTEKGKAREQDILTAGIPSWDRVAKSLSRTGSPLAQRAWERHVAHIRRVRAVLQPGSKTRPNFAERPGGPRLGEIRPLRYPLHPKAEFLVRLLPFQVLGVVEAQEVLDLPAGRLPGYRIRIENSLLDPDDNVYIWQGHCGELGSSVHLETMAMDIETGEMVRIITDETEWLSDLELNAPGRCKRGPN